MSYYHLVCETFEIKVIWGNRSTKKRKIPQTKSTSPDDTPYKAAP